MDKATLAFPNQDMAKAFASAWACKTLSGHDMSAKREDGSFEVTVYNVDERKKEFIGSYIKGLSNGIN